ncbi:MAG: single-stranded DNA-binding protein [Paludibacteraceae bacterium]|jgi:single-strand DNA-binding protein|nr:single-stranded DNA-binding protein [Paludibacteraceae bacterium]MED9996740.1 single-stranded DNA-binding protein [Paludibacteraceae bacterium]
MSLNKVILIGNVGRDPEVRYVTDNVPVASFTLATTKRGYKTQDGKEVPEKTEWHNIVVWRGLAKVAEQYVKKGTQLYIEGELQTRNWEKDGVRHYTTEIIANDMQLLGRKSDNAGGSYAPAAPAAAPAAEPFASSNDSSDELPF